MQPEINILQLDIKYLINYMKIGKKQSRTQRGLNAIIGKLFKNRLRTDDLL
jgi:hypothetical protein